MVKFLSKEVEKNNDDAEKEIQPVRVAYEEALEKANAEASELKKELKKRPPILNVPPVRIEMDPLQVMENKIKEYEHVVQEYQLKLKEWEEIHGKKVGELESIISDLRKSISRKADKPKGTRLARISETLKT